MKDNDIRAAEELFPSGHQPPSDYQRPADHARIVCDKDIAVPITATGRRAKLTSQRRW